jgi:S-layer protein (TIGR01567 family)
MLGIVLAMPALGEMNASGLDKLEARGQVTDLGAANFKWDFKNFAGFYYDVDKNIGLEEVTFTLSGVDDARSTATLTDQPDANNNRGIVYKSTAQKKNFKFKPWGSYWVIGFLADRYFAAFNDEQTQAMKDAAPVELKAPYLYDKSKNRNLMTNEQLSSILIDSATETIITSDAPLKLAEGYELALKYVNGTQALLELSKEDQLVDTKIIQPSIAGATMDDKTYYYKRDIGDTADIVTMAVHFKNCIQGPGKGSATIDGVFQISDTPVSIKADQKYGKMSIREINPIDKTIKMDNKDNQITLSKNKDTLLMTNVYIRTADQVATAADPLRYYIYKKYTEPCTFQIRGSLTNLGENAFTWRPNTFAGFYYDIDKNLGQEELTFTLSGVDDARTTATLSDQTDADNNRGVVYKTTGLKKNFKFKQWGDYWVIGFLAERYFAAFNDEQTQAMKDAAPVELKVPYLYDKSKNRNLMTNEQLSSILIDSATETIITSDAPLKLAEGYELALKGTI